MDHACRPSLVANALQDAFISSLTPLQVAHLLSLASGRPGTKETPAVRPAEFIVLRRGFIFALPHARSPGWEETYGTDRNPFRRYQVRHKANQGTTFWLGPRRPTSDTSPGPDLLQNCASFSIVFNRERASGEVIEQAHRV